MPPGDQTNRAPRARVRAMAVLAAIALACLLWAAPAFSQSKKKNEQNNRSVQGFVTTAEDVPVSGGVVQIKNTKTLQIRSFITKDDGSYQFQGLSPDVDYELKADYQGATSGTKVLSSFDSRRIAIMNLKLGKK
jgi:hypothetical protein